MLTVVRCANGEVTGESLVGGLDSVLSKSEKGQATPHWWFGLVEGFDSCLLKFHVGFWYP